MNTHFRLDGGCRFALAQTNEDLSSMSKPKPT
jgi:hypothetical protein